MMGKRHLSILGFFKRLSIVTIVLVLLYTVVLHINLFSGLAPPTSATAIFIVLFIITGGSHYLNRISNGDPSKVIVFTLLTIVLKLVLYTVFAIVLILVDKESVTSNISLFFILYVVYTIFDVVTIRNEFKESKSV